MAYVSGIAGLGNPLADSLYALVKTQADKSMSTMSRATTSSQINTAWSDFLAENSRVISTAEATEKAILTPKLTSLISQVRNVRDSNLKRVGTTSSASSTSTSSDYVFGDLLTRISPDPKQTTLRPSDYSDLDRASAAAKAKPAEKGVFDAIGDVLTGVADAATSLLPTALAVTKAQQERKQQEQLARLQAAGLLPQQQAQTGMSTTTKVALGAGGALLLGFIIYKVATR